MEESPPPPEVQREVNRELTEFSQKIADQDVILMKLSIEIETTLRDIAKLSGMVTTKVGMGQLIQMLRQREILTDRWLLTALQFFRAHRNRLIHEGKTDDIMRAIDIGRIVLAKLRQIRNELATPSQR